MSRPTNLIVSTKHILKKNAAANTYSAMWGDEQQILRRTFKELSNYKGWEIAIEFEPDPNKPVKTCQDVMSIKHRYINQAGADFVTGIEGRIVPCDFDKGIVIKENFDEIEKRLTWDNHKLEDTIFVWPYMAQAMVSFAMMHNVTNMKIEVDDFLYHMVDFKPRVYYICVKVCLEQQVAPFLQNITI